MMLKVSVRQKPEDGKFTFKNIKLIPGEYLLKGNHKNHGYGEAKFIVDTTDIDLTLLISNEVKNL